MSEESSKMIVSVENISVYFCEQFKHYLAPQSNTQSGQIIFSIDTCLGFYPPADGPVQKYSHEQYTQGEMKRKSSIQ